MKVSVVYFPTDHKWLGIESLTCQRTDFDWELLIFDNDEDFYTPYIPKLLEANCKSIKIIYSPRFEQVAKCDIIVIQTSDCYSHPTRLKDAVSSNHRKTYQLYDCYIPGKGLVKYKDTSNYTLNLNKKGEISDFSKLGFYVREIDPPYLSSDRRMDELALNKILSDKIMSIPEITHFVYPYFAGTNGGPVWEELQHSIRSIKKYFKGPYKIFVVGDNPNIKDVTHIPCKRYEDVSNIRAFDSINKLLKMCESELINDDFIYLYDDIVFLKPFRLVDLKAIISHDFVQDEKTYFDAPGIKPHKTWIDLFINTIHELKKDALPTFNYETHLPRYYNKKKIKFIIDKYKLEEVPLLFHSLYYNNYYKSPKVLLKSFNPVVAGFYCPLPSDVIEKKSFGKLILHYNDSRLSDNLKSFIKKHLL